MNEIMLHPDRDFLNPRNPSSPFAYRRMMDVSVWKYIDKNATPDGGLWNIKINDGRSDYYYFEKTKQAMFNSIRHHF